MNTLLELMICDRDNEWRDWIVPAPLSVVVTTCMPAWRGVLAARSLYPGTSVLTSSQMLGSIVLLCFIS